jgi:hypothetical protein
MAKAKKETKVQKTGKQNFFNKLNIEERIPSKYQTLSAIIVIFILMMIFFAPVYFGGKTFQSGDIVTGKSYQTLKETTDHNLLWNPYVFCGLPSQISGVGYSRWFDLINTGYASTREIFGNIFKNDYAQHTVFLIFLSMAAFYFMRQRNAFLLVCVFVGIATAFSTGMIVFVFIGHITKLYTLAVIPLVFLLLFKFQKKIIFIDVILLAIAISFLLNGWHVQMIFYAFFAIGIYYMFFLVRFLFKKEFIAVKQLLKSAGILVITSILAVATAVDIYAQILEYTEYSTRGTKSITEIQLGETQKSESAFYDYATSWSFSPGEVLTFIVPSYYGFGNVTYKGNLSNNEEVEINTYFGQMPFVDVAMYMGVLVFFLGIFGMYSARKQPLVQYLTFLIIISLLISFGKNFSAVFDLMFYYFPFFDKFRVPSMILTLIQISLPILAGIGIMEIISLRNERNQKAINFIKYLAIGFTVLLILSLLLSGSITQWFSGRVAESARGQQLSQISDFIAQIFRGDLYLALFFTALTFWLAYGYIKNMLSRDTLVLLIVFMTVVDLFRISGRGAKFVDKQDVSGLFNEPAYITAIKNQNDDNPFRLLNLKQDGSLGSFSQNSNYNMYFLMQDLAGYSGIKPRSYQDYIDVVGPANPTLWRMLNVKYIVLDNTPNVPGFTSILTQEKNYVFKNERTLPRAYFVDRVEVKEPLNILNDVKNNLFDPKEVAYTKEHLSVDIPDSTASINIQSYGNDKIKIEATASGNNLLFLGDTYYPHGWSATIDGKETEIYRVNHGFRGIIIPKGTHKVEFNYAPDSYYLGKIISLFVNIILLGGLAVGIFLNFKRKNNPK